MKKILFIVSAGRSGSTLLDMVIGSHSKCFTIGEISRLPDSIKKNSLCGCGEILQNCGFWRRINSRLYKRYGESIYKSSNAFNLSFWQEYQGSNRYGYYYKIFKPLLGIAKLNMTWVHNTRTLFNEIFEETQAEVLVDSTKDIFRAMLLRSSLKEYQCKFIHLVRDGRAVVNSMQKKSYSVYEKTATGDYIKRTYPGIYTKPEDAILGWRKYNLKTLLLLKLVSPKNRMLLRFEDFCEEPEKRAKEITSFLGLPFHETMTNFRDTKHHSIAGNPTKVGKGGIKKPDRDWEQNLSKQALDMFAKKAGFLNKYFHYI